MGLSTKLRGPLRVVHIAALALLLISCTAPTITTPFVGANTELPAPRATARATQRPTVPPANGATAKCNDGTYSYSATHSGTCSHHGGVAVWYK